MKKVILGTAGHIDHGKTTLVKALTGTNTDRLKEEQARGITIELGFASLDLPSGQHVGIVDVPGHEKFVKHMVAGASGIDIVSLIIAADEGVMPQTREHLEICILLGVKFGFVVLTKTDMVDEEWLELVIEDVRDFIQGTFLENSPIVPVSSVTGEGIPEFIQTLDNFCEKVPSRSSAGLFRLPVDRVFTMKGFGTVITGTLISGNVSVGDSIMIYPSAVTSKVRGIQVHNDSVMRAEAGMRTAINFQGLDKSVINRGDVLSTPGALMTSYMVDVSLHFLESNKKAIKNRARVRFHTGTIEILGLLILLDREKLEPGETAVAQIRLDGPVALVKEDRYVLRSYSPVRTIGGGKILNPVPIKHKRHRTEVIKSLESLRDLQSEQIAVLHIRESGFTGVSFAALKVMTNTADKQLESMLQHFLSTQQIVIVDKENRTYVHRDTLIDLKMQTQKLLENYHRSNPLRTGMAREELKSRLPSTVSSKLFNLLINVMVKEGEIVQEEENVRLSSHKISLQADQTAIRDKLLKIYRQSRLAPPNFKDVPGLLNVEFPIAKDVLMLLLKERQLIKVNEELYFDVSAIEELKNRLVDFLKKHGEINTPDFKNMTNVSRKYVIPLIEYFDSKNVTIRVGDIRKLRSG
ncbi:MAG: selenocysteine-specific translation elongation factor [Desulfobacterales bacterium]